MRAVYPAYSRTLAMTFAHSSVRWKMHDICLARHIGAREKLSRLLCDICLFLLNFET